MEPLNRKRIPLVSGPEETMTLLPLPPGDEHPERFQLSTWHGHDELLFSGSVDRAGLEQLVMAGAELLGLAVPTGLYTMAPVITDPATGALIRPDAAETYVALIEDDWSTVEAVSDFLTARRATPAASLGTTTLERLANDPTPEHTGYGAGTVTVRARLHGPGPIDSQPVGDYTMGVQPHAPWAQSIPAMPEGGTLVLSVSNAVRRIDQADARIVPCPAWYHRGNLGDGSPAESYQCIRSAGHPGRHDGGDGVTWASAAEMGPRGIVDPELPADIGPGSAELADPRIGHGYPCDDDECAICPGIRRQ